LSSGSWKYIGRRMKRKEDLRVLLGDTKYLDDIKPKDSLTLGIVRSQYARASFKVDFSQVKDDPRVKLIITSDDIDKNTNPIPIISAPSGCKKLPWKALAIETANFVGEPIAALVVEGNAYTSNDILEKVYVNYAPEEPVIDALKSMNSQHVIHKQWGSNIVYSTEIKRGSVDAAFSSAYAIIKENSQ